MQKSTIVFNCLEHDLASYSSAKSSLSVFAQSIFLNTKILILSYKISKYIHIYEDSFVAKMLRDDCTLNLFKSCFSLFYFHRNFD